MLATESPLTIVTSRDEVLATSSGRTPEPGSTVVVDAAGVRYEVVAATADGDGVRVTVEPFAAAEPALVAEFGAGVPPASSRRIESTDGVQLTLHQLGGEGRPLLICHATGFHGLAYAPLARALAAHFAVWALDLRGHGASTPPVTGDFAWKGMAEDVLACVDEIGADSVIGVGHSLGGASLLLAELARPGVVEAAYLFEPIVFPAERLAARGENPMSGPARRRRPAFPTKRAAFERYVSRPPLDQLRTDALAAYVEHGFVETDGEVRLACEPEHEARTFEAEDKMTFDLLAGMQLPLLVAAGQVDDDPSPAEFAPMIVETVDGAELRPHPELGHFGPLEAPDRVAAEIIDWLA